MKVIRCKDCALDGNSECPLSYIEKQTLCFVEHSPMFFCGKAKPTEDYQPTNGDVIRNMTDRQLAERQNSIEHTAYIAVCGVLTAMVRRGRTKQYIQNLYKDMCLLFSTPEMFGKQISMADIMHTLESEYGIDWKKLEVHIESEKHYLTGVRKAVKANEQ